tara:strand:- start:1463 stop:1588 length:126 start_codon:yes stop_codon:yes gene_type:complete
MAGQIQTNSGTNTIPLFLFIIYGLSGVFFVYGIIRAFRLVR